MTFGKRHLRSGSELSIEAVERISIHREYRSGSCLSNFFPSSLSMLCQPADEPLCLT